jgi:hypothetical protein
VPELPATRTAKPIAFIGLLAAIVVLYVFELWTILTAVGLAAVLVGVRRRPPPPAV